MYFYNPLESFIKHFQLQQTLLLILNLLPFSHVFIIKTYH